MRRRPRTRSTIAHTLNHLAHSKSDWILRGGRDRRRLQVSRCGEEDDSSRVCLRITRRDTLMELKGHRTSVRRASVCRESTVSVRRVTHPHSNIQMATLTPEYIFTIPYILANICKQLTRSPLKYTQNLRCATYRIAVVLNEVTGDVWNCGWSTKHAPSCLICSPMCHMTLHRRRSSGASHCKMSGGKKLFNRLLLKCAICYYIRATFRSRIRSAVYIIRSACTYIIRSRSCTHVPCSLPRPGRDRYSICAGIASRTAASRGSHDVHRNGSQSSGSNKRRAAAAATVAHLGLALVQRQPGATYV